MWCSHTLPSFYKNIAFWVGFILLSSSCISQLRYVRQLTVSDGLPQGQVRGMVQDKQGFMWIASEGLSRYDGRVFLNYKHTIGDTASIADNDIRDLQLDDQGNLWIVYASKVVDIMNTHTGAIRHLSAEPAFQWLTTWTPKQVHFTIRLVGSRYFAATNNSLITFNPVTGKRQVIGVFDREKLMAIGSRKDGSIVLATTRALYQLQGNEIQLLRHLPPLPNAIVENWNAFLNYRKSIGTILITKAGKWMIPAMGGMYRYDPEKDTCTYFGNTASLRIPYTAVLAKNQSAYISLDSGIYQLSNSGPARLVYGNQGYAPMYALLTLDRSGVLWASADIYGIQLFSPDPDNFRSLPSRRGFAIDVLQPWIPPVPPQAYFGSYELRLAKDTGGKVWLLNQAAHQPGSADKKYTELYRFGIAGAVRQPLQYAETARPYLMAFDKQNRCWLALRDTVTNPKRLLAKADLQTGAIRPWVAIPGGWKENGYLTTIDRYVCYLPEDELRLYDTATATCTIYSKEKLGISGLLLMALPDRQNKNLLWIATKGSGITTLNVATGAVQHYTEENGLPNNTVYYIAPDKKGFFWCSSNKGLFRFSPTDGSVVAFTVKDGLQGNEFNRYHFLETPDGHFWFGGTEGHTVFHPNSVFLDSYQTPIAITNLQVNNIPLQKLAPQWQDSLVSNLRSITLSHTQNQLSFSFAGLQYNAPEKLQYRYRLLGIDKGWVYAGYDARANYAAVPPGHYTLQVNATNTSGKWSHYLATLEVVISPPWWLTWWMYAVYALLLAGAIYFFIRTRLRRLQLRQQVILKQQEAEQAHALEETKSRFFANITHELRTPLTLILSPVQRQLQEGATTYSPQLLKGVYHNSQMLLRLINQLLDMSKLEAGNLPLNLHRGHVVAFIKSLLPPFQQQAAARGIHFLFSVNDTPVAPVRVPTNRNTPSHQPVGATENEGKEQVPVRGNTIRGSAEERDQEHLFDSDKLEKVLYNLLSNAFKFTPDGGQISCQLSVSQWSDEGHASIHSPQFQPGDTKEKTLFQIQISDTGIGIPPAHLPHIFNRFYQVNTSTTRKYEGTGIGLSLVQEFTQLMGGTITAESTPGNGSIFTLTLPLAIAQGNEAVILPAQSQAIALSEIETDMSISSEEQDECKPLVLVTDDNGQLRRFIATSLAPHYRVITAENGEEGLQKAVAELPELIISDVMMPVMDGYEFCQKVKGNPLTSHIGFILLTAKTADESRVSGLRLGADHYLGKPFMVEELLLVIANLLKRQQQLRELYHRQLQQPTEALPPVKEVEDEFLRSVYSIIEAHLNSASLDVDFLASQMAVSRRTLNRKLASISNTSANEIIRHYRLKKAAVLLLQGEAVSSAAYTTGFSTPSYFTQCFKEMYGTTPVQWAENGGLAQNR